MSETALDSDAWRSPYRHTIKRIAHICGVGVHSGLQSCVTLRPAREAQGVTLNSAPLSAWRLATAQWATRLKRDELSSAHTSDTRSPCLPLPHTLSTVEHLLAALYGAGVDDVHIELNSDPPRAEVEAPILDGSALPYLQQIEPTLTGGLAIKREVLPLPALEIIRDEGRLVSSPDALMGAEGSLSIRLTTSLGELYPELQAPTSETPLSQRVSQNINQKLSAELLSARDFREMIAPARTFGLRAHEPRLRAQGLIQGVSLESCIVLDSSGIPHTRLRHPHELASHKLLDVLGDLALSQRRWRGHLEVSRGAHTLNHDLLSQLGAEVATHKLKLS